MNGNPINRLAAVLGLVAVGLIAYGVVTGSLELVEAAQRAGLTFFAVIVVRAIGRIGLTALAGSMERASIAEQPKRRATDQV